MVVFGERVTVDADIEFRKATSRQPIEDVLVIFGERMTENEKAVPALFHIGGELLDTEATFRGLDAANPLSIAEQKTASYSFVSPLVMGATLAETNPDQITILQSFGEQLGVAYQLRDDMIGIFGDEAVTGKSVSSDIVEGKRTLLIEEFYNRADETQRITFDALFGRHNLKTSEVATVKRLLIESGAKEAIEILIDAYHKHTNTLVGELTIDELHKDAFRNLIDICLKRDS